LCCQLGGGVEIFMSEYEKMLSGEWIFPSSPELKEMRIFCNHLIFDLNQIDNSQKQKRYVLLKRLLGDIGEDVNIKSIFQCDYGKNIHVGNHVFINYNCVIADVGKVVIHDHVKIGPQVGIYTVNHPLDPAERLTGKEHGKKIEIGENCWIGGHSVINPGVTLGRNVVVASGTVVTKSFGDNVLVAGVPARVLKSL
jgi:maltose O-acetyltransferase